MQSSQTVHKLSLADAMFPKNLANIDSCPKELYYLGSWDQGLFESCVAIVGSRRMTPYGEKVTKLLVQHLAMHNITVVSGFMYGIDAAAHKFCIEYGCRTIAVMPAGVDQVIPEYQTDLFTAIIKNKGIILSEHPPGTVLFGKGNFVRRNRIVVGLCPVTIVVEAAVSSGSLISAALANKLGRVVYAVPGPITSITSVGTNMLIKNNTAVMLSDFSDIVKFFGSYGTCLSDLTGAAFSKEVGLPTTLPSDPIFNTVVSAIDDDGVFLDAILDKSGLSVEKLSATISELELLGFIRCRYGKYFRT